MTSLIANNVQNIEELFSYTETRVKDYIIDIATDHLEKVNQRKDEFNINIHEHFNIFTAIAEKYRHEKLHSDLLKVILGNEKNNIDNLNVFYKFLDYIGIDDKEKYFSDYNSIKFQREYPIKIPLKGNGKGKKDKYKRGRIDLLIHTDDACIIIENKVNGAPDQPNQLGKYYIQMLQDNKKFIKIVYLTIKEKAHPDNFAKYNFNDYNLPNGSTTESIKEDIKDVLINLPCVKEKEQNVKTFTEFLEEIEKLFPVGDENTFIKHYKSLIESIGGKVLMIDLEKELIKNIMKNSTNIQAVKMLIDTWNDRTSIIGKLLVDEKDIVDPEMKKAPDDSTICQKKIYENVNIYYTYNERETNKNIEFGFRPISNTFTQEEADTLLGAFNSLAENIFIFKPKGKIERNKKDDIIWVYAHVYDLKDSTHPQIRKELINCLNTLKNEATKSLKAQKN